MRKPVPGDLVLHNYHFAPDGKRAESYLCGYSRVAQNAVVRTDEPPKAGEWSGRGEYYRIELDGYVPLASPLDFRTFTANYSQALRDEVEYHSPKFFPFTISAGNVRVNQGMYLTRVSELLYSSFLNALGVEAAITEPRSKKEAHGSYAEGERAKREVSYFLRHPELARDAKEHYGYVCQLCGFNPEKVLGKAWRSTAIDCHHLDPLSERVNFNRPSTLKDVAILCANCHRLVHSRRPALSIDEAKCVFKIKPFTLGEGL